MVEVQLAAMIGVGDGLLVGAVSPDGEPGATRAWAATVVDPDARRLRVVIAADDVAVESLRNGVMALTSADVRTLRSRQLKGRVVLIDEPDQADLDTMAEQSAAFFEAVHATDGNSMELLQRLLPARVVVVEFVVDELYDQTPGPGAGAPVAGEGS